jgi:hypothetical protein
MVALVVILVVLVVAGLIAAVGGSGRSPDRRQMSALRHRLYICSTIGSLV